MMSQAETIKLTSLSTRGDYGCKMGPSACHSGETSISPVLKAMKVSEEILL
jgi:cysteine sulfinate desulfinase/cysteine desulfurase-like protein